MEKIVISFSLLFMLMFSAISFAGDITSNGINQDDLYSFLANTSYQTLNASHGSAGIGIEGTASLNIKTSTTINYTSNGVWKSLVSSASISVTNNYSGTIVSQNASTYCKYLVCANGSGAFKIIKGNVSNYSVSALLPKILDGYTAIGYFRVETAASTTFKLGVSRLDGTGITTTYVNLAVLNDGKSAVKLTGL